MLDRVDVALRRWAHLSEAETNFFKLTILVLWEGVTEWPELGVPFGHCLIIHLVFMTGESVKQLTNMYALGTNDKDIKMYIFVC